MNAGIPLLDAERFDSSGDEIHESPSDSAIARDDTDLVAILIRQRIDEELRLHRRIDQLTKALAPFVKAYAKYVDPGYADLYDEQPQSVHVTLGDCRKAQRVLEGRG